MKALLLKLYLLSYSDFLFKDLNQTGKEYDKNLLPFDTFIDSVSISWMIGIITIRLLIIIYSVPYLNSGSINTARINRKCFDYAQFLNTMENDVINMKRLLFSFIELKLFINIKWKSLFYLKILKWFPSKTNVFLL